MRSRKLIIASIIFVVLPTLATGQARAQTEPTIISPLPNGAPEKTGPSAHQILQNRQVQESLKTATEPILTNENPPTPTPPSGFLPTPQRQLDLSQQLLKLLDPLELTNGHFSGDLTVLGNSSLSSTTVSGPLTQDGTLIIDEGQSINVIGGTLSLQSLGLGDIDFINGKMTLDREGNLALAGSLDLGGDLAVGGDLSLHGTLTASSLNTNLISPLAQSGLTIQLGSLHASPTGFLRPEARLVVTNRKGDERLSIDEGGDLATLGNLEGENVIARNKAAASNLEVSHDLIVGGRAEFETLAANGFIRGDELMLDKGLRINTSRARFGQDPGTGATAGQSVFPSGIFTYTIDNTTVTGNSLIYLTPVGSFESQALFVRSIRPGRSFSVGLDHPLLEPATFNWLIIN